METQAKRTTRSAANKRKLCTSGGNPDSPTAEKKYTKSNVKTENLEVASSSARRFASIKASIEKELDSLDKDEKTSKTLNETEKGTVLHRIIK